MSACTCADCVFADFHTESVAVTYNEGTAVLKNCDFLNNTLAPSNSSAVIRATANWLEVNQTGFLDGNTHIALEGCASPTSFTAQLLF